jgi:PAS domain S-box-containing protein
MMTQWVFGIQLVGVGIGLLLLTYFLLRLATSKPPLKPSDLEFPTPHLPIQSVSDAVFLVGEGGRVIFSNTVTQKWFGYANGEPNLERIAQRIHPPDALWGLCFTEGKAQFTLDGSLMEGFSYIVPVHQSTKSDKQPDTGNAMLVIIRPLRMITIKDGTEAIPHPVLEVFSDLNRKIVSNLELEPGLQAILESVESLITSDTPEISLLDHASGNLNFYRLVNTTGGERILAKGSPRSILSSGFTGHLLRNKKPLLLNNYKEIMEISDTENNIGLPVQSYVGVPLSDGSELVGTLELTSSLPDCFTGDDLALLKMFAEHSVVAIRNATRFTEVRNRAFELSGLINLAMAASTIWDLQDLFDKLVENISRFIEVKYLGFLIYRPRHQLLEAQLPFRGIPAQLLDLYRVEIPTGSIAEEILTSQEIILAPEAANDPVLKNLGLDGMAVASGIQSTVLVPLKAQARVLGYMQIADRHDDLPFNEDYIRLLEIVASQASVIIENGLLRVESSQTDESLRLKVAQLETELIQVRTNLTQQETQLPVNQKHELETSNSLMRTRQRLRRIQAALDIVEHVDQLRVGEEILKVFAERVLADLDMDCVLIGTMGEGGPRLFCLVGDVPEGVNTPALLGQRNPLRACLQLGKVYFARNLDSEPEWADSPLLIAFEAKSFICQPILPKKPDPKKQELTPAEFGLLAMRRSPLPEYDASDFELFNILSSQVTIALENSRLINESNQRLREMDLLLEFSYQLGVFDTHSIVKTLLDNVLKVIPSAEAGLVALWSDEQKLLIPHAAQGYSNNSKMRRISYRSGVSLPGKVFSDGQPINLAEVDFAREYQLSADELLLYRDATEGKLPLSCLAIPLLTFDTHIGVLVVDNFHLPGAFSREDQALVLALSHQTALRLQNVRLYQAVEARAVQLSALTDVSRTITSSLQTEDLINSLLSQARSVVPFDSGVFWLRQGDQMTVRAAIGFLDIEERVGLTVSLEDSLLLHEMATQKGPVSVEDVRKDNRFSVLTEPQFLSWLGVPLLSKEEVVGVIALEKDEPGFFTADHIQAMVAFSGQVAVALENANLYEESLRRADELNNRSIRLALLNRLSTALSGSIDLEHILRMTADEILQVFGGSNVSVALVDAKGELYVHWHTPPGKISLPYKLPGAPIFDHLNQSLGIFIAEDISQEPELAPLSGFLSPAAVVSLLIVPLITSNNLIGFTFIHAQEFTHYSPDEVSLALTISNQVASAIQNARLFAETERLMLETQKSSRELTTLYDLGVQITQVLEQSRLLDIIFENVMRLIEPDAIVVDNVESERLFLAHIYDHGERKEPHQIERKTKSLSEYVIQTNKPLLVGDIQSGEAPVSGIIVGSSSRCWLGVPLVVRGMTNGVLSVQSDRPHAFDEDHLQLLSQIANQLSVGLDNAQLFQTVQDYTLELEQRVSERTEQVEREHRRIQTLLSITTELSASLDLDTVLSRSLGVLNETIDAEHSTILLLQADNPYLFLRASFGYIGRLPQTGQVASIKRNEGLAGWVLQNRQSILIEDLHDEPLWIQRQDRTSLHRSAMAVPLMVGNEVIGALMVYHRSPGMFANDHLDLVQAVAKQIAISINNTHLYGLIREQAERLGLMLRTQHVETSRSQAILEAVADGVMVTDSQRIITLFNASAENILSLSRNSVVGQSLEHFTGLFGKSARSWVRAIRNWSEKPDTIIQGDTYEAQIELDDRRVVSVHLSPVQLHSDFLGTVSVFRDITHQVEVDRLKSEFVATVSHELRTPMTSIKGYVEILLMGAAGMLNPQQNRYLEVVKANSDRLAVLVNDLLDVSRIEAGKIVLSFQPVNIQDTVVEAVEMLNRRMESENRFIEIKVIIPQDLPLVLADPERIRQVLSNLLENAYQYTPVGGHIWLMVEEKELELRVEIRDDGIGIKPEEAGRVFERFYRGEDPLVLATSGTGLGLSIVQTLIQMHKGSIWFESEGIPGRGSIFSFTIPVYNPLHSPDLTVDGDVISETQTVEKDNDPGH